MAKDRKKLQHIHSSVPDKQPTVTSLEVGEIAVNNAANQEFLSIKNSDNKVVRFSSDAQMIEWTERKEVMPYEGYTRGSEGPDGSTGPDSVTNDDLLQNKSNLIIKLNQVAASATTKHDVVNGAKDIYNKEVNPTTDGGVTDGAGFAIDMSRYAMIDANPSFSSLTVTVQTELSGNTTISDGANTNEYGTDSGHTLTIETTDVVVNDTNWVEEITNKESKITTLDESATTRTTVIGTDNLTVSGTTTESHVGNVTITNSGNVSETTVGNVVENISGTTTINRKGNFEEANQGDYELGIIGTTSIDRKGDVFENNQGDVTVVISGDSTETKEGAIEENNLSTKTENTTGVKTENNSDDYIVNTEGDVQFTTTGDTSIHSDGNIAISADEDICEAAGVNASFFAVTKTNIGLDCEDTESSTTTNIYGSTINKKADTSNTTAATTTLSGGTLSVTEADSVSISTPATDLSGTSLTINETNTTINSCGKVEIKSNDFKVSQCDEEAGSAEFEFCDGYKISSDNVEIEQCTEDGSMSIKENGITVSGTTFEMKETNVNISGTTKISGNTTIDGNLIIPITCTTITSTTVNDALCEVLSKGGISMTRETTPDDSRLSAIYRLWQNGSQIGYDINVPKDGFLKEVKLVDVSGISYLRFTWNVYDAETQTYSTGTTDVNVEELVKQIEANNPSDNGTAANHNVAVDVWYNTTTGKMNVSASTTPTMHVTNMYATGTVSAATGNITTANITTANVTTGNITTLNAGPTTISGAAKVNNTLTVTGNTTLANATASTLNATNVYVSGTVTGATVSGTNVNGGTISGTTVKGVTISGTNVNAATKVTTNALDVTGTITAASGFSKKVTWAAGAFTANTTGYNGSADRVITVPTDASHITRKTLSVTHNGLTDTYDPGASANKSMTLPHSSLTVSFGTATAQTSNVVYNTSAAKTITIPTKITHLTNDLSNLTFATGTTSVTGSPYNGSAAKTITIPSDASHITRKTLTIQKNSSNVGSYDPGATANTTINIGVPTKVSELTNDLSYLKWSLGTPSADTTGYNGSAAKTITIPSKISNLTNDLSNLTFQTGNTSVQSPYNGSAAKTVTIPASVDNLTNYNSSTGIITLPHNVSVSGTVTATGAVYSSDRNLKENIKPISRDDINKVGKVLTRSFNFKDDEAKRKTYGVIAQDVLDAGIGEIVHTGEDGMLGVDYTSLLILKIAYLEAKLSDLEEKIKENKN